MKKNSLVRPNGYVCCRCLKMTIVAHKKNTQDYTAPEMIACWHDGCGYPAYSCDYKVPPNFVEKATLVWSKPTQKDLKRLEGAMKEHVKQGGMLLREVPHVND